MGVVLNRVIQCGRRAERGSSLCSQNAEDINGKAGVMYSYCCVVTVQCRVLGRVVTQTVSSRSSTANGRVLSQASAVKLCWKD